MNDPNIFAVLYPCDQKDRARNAFCLEHNANRYRKPVEGIAEEPIITSREPTPAPQLSPQVNHGSAGHILLTFDKKPKDPKRGWQFGTNPDVCDVLLGYRGTPGISGRHFCITIDENLRPQLQEDSTYGTTVSYDSIAKYETRKKFSWLLSSGPGMPRRWSNVTVYVPGDNWLAFEIEFPNHEGHRMQYVENLMAFLEEGRTALPPVNALGLNSNPPTAAPTLPRTPHQRPIYLDDKSIARGSFGKVLRVINASTGDFYAAKKFYPPKCERNGGKKRKRKEESWLDKIRNEIAIMKENPHVCVTPLPLESGLIVRKPHIMQVIDFQETPEPLLLMPYYPHGNLEDLRQARDITKAECVSAFRQILLGLRHLHERRVVHRDLKPANLLLAEPFTIVISDFGIAKVSTDRPLTSVCGTASYIAPEVYPGYGYGTAVDIWSTGVIMLELVHCRPDHPVMKGATAREWNKRWCKMLVKVVNDCHTDNKIVNILIDMLKLEPNERLTADECLERGCAVGLLRRDTDDLIVDGDDTWEDGEGMRTLTQQSVSETESGECGSSEGLTDSPTASSQLTSTTTGGSDL